jgi:shikimate kinase
MGKVLYMLIGLKGSGKTHIGTLVNRNTNIKFLRVESVWLSLQPGEDGWQVIEQAIDDLFLGHDRVMVESLGAGEGFKNYYESLRRKYTIRMIRVKASPETCLERVRNRSRQDHIPVSEAQVIEYNKLAAAVTYAWDLEIDNDHPASDETILNEILSINDATNTLKIPQSSRKQA